MGRGKLSPEVVRQRALDKAAEVLRMLGGSDEELKQVATVEEPAETTLDKIREAESAIIYFDTQGFKFKEKICKTCGKKFAYRWNVDSISNCSIECCKESLRRIGLDWDPHRPQEQRWGRYLPAVIPPGALEILKDLSNDSLEDPASDTHQ
jgi:hypothetical protein